MATISMASYPHIEINVIDESIYQYSNTRILPLQRDLFPIRAQKGRVGVLAWYDQYIEAETALGAETFNDLNPKYCSNDSIFIKNVMTNNGCFIVRLAERETLTEAPETFKHDGITERTGAIKALQILEAVVKCGDTTLLDGADIMQYERTSTGAYMVNDDGDKIPYKLDVDGNHVEPYTADGAINDAWAAISDTEPYTAPKEAWTEYVVAKVTAGGTIDSSNVYYELTVNGDYAVTSDETFQEGKEYYTKVDHAAVTAAAGVKTVKGVEINWRWRYAYYPKGGSFSEREKIENMKAYEEGIGNDAVMVYPMIVFEAASPGAWGNDNCLEFFYDSSINSRDEAQILGNVRYTLKPQYKVYGKSTINPYFDMRGNNAVTFVMEPGKIDDRYMEAIGFNQVLDNSYDLANPLPWNVTYFNENWKTVCEMCQKFEMDYYTETYDSATKVIETDTAKQFRVLLTKKNYRKFANKKMALYASADAATFDHIAIIDEATANAGTWYVNDYAVVNEPGDKLADSDKDGVWGVDTWYNDEGEQISYLNMTAYYNAQGDLASPWLVNIVSGLNLDAVPYNAIVVNENLPYEPSIELAEAEFGKKYIINGRAYNRKFVNEDDGTTLYPAMIWRNAYLISDVVHYASNGKDGSLTDWDHEQNVRDFYGLKYQYEDTWNPKNIVDRGRYPYNTIFDTGYTLETKNALCDFLTVREDVKVVLSTQTCNKYINTANGNTMYPVLNTMAQDESVGTALQSRVQLMRESIIKGTACCRATIFAHAGYLYGNYGGIVPMTLWSAIKGSEHYNTTSMRGTCKGWPNSKCDIFKTLNWVAPDEAAHERHWNIGINYVQYYDMDNLHFPSVRTVYKYDTSVLLDDEFTDAIIFTKQAVRDSWATYVGMDTPQAEYEALVNKDVSNRLLNIFNGRYKFNVRAYQTAEERNRGYVQHVAVTIESPAVKRVWLVDVICRRENFDPAAAAV